MLTYRKSHQNDENLYPIAILSHFSHPQNRRRSGNDICMKSPDSLPQYKIFDFQICRFPYHEISHDFFCLIVAIATTRYFSGVKYIPEHILVVIFVSSREDSLMFARLSVFPREELRCIIGLCRTHFIFRCMLFLGAGVFNN